MECKGGHCSAVTSLSEGEVVQSKVYMVLAMYLYSHASALGYQSDALLTFALDRTRPIEEPTERWRNG